ncbi:MAG: hypothetical protein J6W22_11790 [Fibrobacter sp.]|nr:hypothetical protein [Fibrobacter sp.]
MAVCLLLTVRFATGNTLGPSPRQLTALPGHAAPGSMPWDVARDRIASSTKLEASHLSVGLIPNILSFFQKI